MGQGYVLLVHFEQLLYNFFPDLVVISLESINNDEDDYHIKPPLPSIPI